MKRLHSSFAFLLIVTLLASCGQPTAETPTATTAPAVAEAPPTGAAAPMSPAGPAVGGALVVAWPIEPATLDAQKNFSNAGEFVTNLIGANLVTLDPQGNVVPWLAESWKVSDDGLTWEFKLRTDATFHDGTPLTAQDYAWTFQRAIAPETQAGVASAILGPLASAEAVDDHTLRLIYAEPYFWLLQALTYGGYLQPLPKATLEKMGEEDFGRSPVGVGPYRFKEWVTGEKIVLERNPDYNWGPAFTHGGAPYIETIEIRYIAEYATVIAGVEAGEIDYAVIETKDVSRLRDSGDFDVFESVQAGINPFVVFNVTHPPFDDARVRQAFNLAVDRPALIKSVMQGAAVEQRGPASQTMAGYWAGAEDIGYGYELEKARSLLAEAGYALGADGTWEKDGQPFQVTLHVRADDDMHVKTAQVLQQQFKALGVDVTLESVEGISIWGFLAQNDYQFGVLGITYTSVDVIMGLFHSAYVGVFNMGGVNDPELDPLLEKTRATMDAAEQAKYVEQSHTRIIEQAYMIPLFAPKHFPALSHRVKGATFSPMVTLAAGYTQIYLDDAYIESGP